MERFIVGCGYNEYQLDIDRCKYLLGTDLKTKYQIYMVIKSFFNKVNNSEYANEQCAKHILKSGDSNIDTKNWRFFEVTPFFDLETDLKMGSKSLISKYFDCYGDFLERNEVYNSLIILLDTLNSDFFDEETVLPFGDKTMKLQIAPINRGTISKEVFPLIESNGFQCNSADISYDEMILLQLNMIKNITSKDKTKKTIVFCSIPYLTKEIEIMIKDFCVDGTYLIIDTGSIPDTRVEDVCVTGKYYIDLANKDNVIDKVMDFPFHIDVDDMMKTIQKCLRNQKYDFSNRLIVELFS